MIINAGMKIIKDDNIEIVLSDKGPGIPKEINPRKSKSMGMFIIYLLLEGQLKGKAEMDSSDGTQWKITLPILTREKRI